MRKTIYVILTLIFAFALIFSGYKLYQEYSEQQESIDLYTDLEEFVSVPDEAPNTTNPSESGETTPAYVGPAIDFDELKKINDDCVAWIYIEDTDINYPIVQGSDNSYYLKHLIDGKWNSSGSIFMDSRVSADISDRHSIIYGHHMKNGTMFSGLTKYKEQEYFDAHPEGWLITPEGTYRIEFFAGYVANVKSAAWDLEFESDADFETWIKEAQKQSWFTSPFSPAVTDRILTLSTCSYEFDNARYVLHGIVCEVEK